MRQLRLILLLLAVLTLPSLSRAEAISPVDLLVKLPSLNQGVAFSLNDNKLNYLSTIDIVKWKGFNIEAGYAGQAKETGDKAVAVLSYDLINLGSTNIPILKYVDFRPGVYAGWGRLFGSNEFDYGISASVVSIKF